MLTYKDILSDHGPRIEMRQAEHDNYTARCPWCGEYQLAINPRTNTFMCFNTRCEAYKKGGGLDLLDKRIRER